MYTLYLLYSEAGEVQQWKIGVSTNLQRRFNEIKLANPNAVGFLSSYNVDDREIAYGVEAMIKRHLKQHTISGEWIFYEALTVDKFQELCRNCEQNYRIHLQIQKNLKQRYDY